MRNPSMRVSGSFGADQCLIPEPWHAQRDQAEYTRTLTFAKLDGKKQLMIRVRFDSGRFGARLKFRLSEAPKDWIFSLSSFHTSVDF